MLDLLITLLAIYWILNYARLLAQLAACRLLGLKLVELWPRWPLFNGYVLHEPAVGLRPRLVPAASLTVQALFIYVFLTTFWLQEGWGWLSPDVLADEGASFIGAVWNIGATGQFPDEFIAWLDNPAWELALPYLLYFSLLVRLVSLSPVGRVGMGVLIGAFESLSDRTAWSWLEKTATGIVKTLVYTFLLLSPWRYIFILYIELLIIIKISSFAVKLSVTDSRHRSLLLMFIDDFTDGWNKSATQN